MLRGATREIDDPCLLVWSPIVDADNHLPSIDSIDHTDDRPERIGAMRRRKLLLTKYLAVRRLSPLELIAIVRCLTFVERQRGIAAVAAGVPRA